ncbi:LysR substrate-binding domain-containing protein [Streptomyces scopuliridis]|uniref:LysR family transcriptional regulator n=1 Tax=Streptomyces scopuliridis RB72 TaxID=1440053 RepID=A0A2T7T8Q8_9ACTN|nr:LysR substrate-binding domain-containing protein [Streptomyces scopuliridis]PVE11527.1 LysR family transcriptional regulator [Streptomyces scopuliridis RB72]
MDLRTLRYFVAVAEELHFGRAAVRLHMTQPPLSRAIQQLETDLGCTLLHRSPSGVALTTAGAALYDEARTLLAQAEHVRTRVTAVAGAATLTVGTLADSAEQAGTRLAAAYRQRHPTARVRIREADFTDPTAGLRTGLVDVALTRAPFDTTGITIRVLRSDPVGVVLRADDPLADRESLRLDELADRRWFQLPEGTDPAWRAYWSGPPAAAERGDGPVVRTVHECLQSILWDGTVGLTSLAHALPEGLTSVALTDKPSSDLVIAWNSTDTSPLIRSFVHVATAVYGAARKTT